MSNQRQANGSLLRPLTSLQIAVLKCHADKPERAIAGCPHGVYRALVIRGCLWPTKLGYELTPEGRKHVDDMQWSLT